MSDQINYEQLAKALLSQKAAGTTPTASYGHGPGGVFSPFGLSKPVFSALILPYLGLGGMLPAVPSMDTNPLWGIMTGVTAPEGAEPTNVCDDCKTSGKMKLCTHSVPYGRYCMDTRVYQVDRAGERWNRAEFTDLTLINQAFAGPQNGMLVPGLAGGKPLQSEFDKAMFEFAVSFGRLYADQLWSASPANNTAGGGYREFVGLDLQINTGHVDAETGVACPAADSFIYSMANAEINSNGEDYVAALTGVIRNLRYIASRTGSNPVRFALSMRWGAFYELTAIWPCAYLTYRCTTSGNVEGSIDSAAAVRMRDEMRGDYASMTGQFLWVDGEKIQVIIDDGITETMAAGETFLSSIYVLPLTVSGGTPVLYWEYFDFSSPNAAEDIMKMAPDGSYFISDGGRFLWHRKPPSNWCVEMSALTKPRIRLDTPYLAGRLTNVAYTPFRHERDWNTAASYYANGGGTDRDFFGPSYYEPVPR